MKSKHEETKPRYSREDKLRALQLVDAGGRVYEVAKKLGIEKNTLYAWTSKNGRQEILGAIEAVRAAKAAQPTNGHTVEAPPPPVEAVRFAPANDDVLAQLEVLKRENAALRELVRVYQGMARL